MVTLMPFFFPHSLAKPSIQVSNWGTKWLHCRTLNVLVWASAVVTKGAEIAGAKPAVPAATPARFRKLRRVMVRLSSFPPDRIDGLLWAERPARILLVSAAKRYLKSSIEIVQ